MSRRTYSGKVVVVGDGACGKTCLLEVFKRNRFPEEYIPTVVDNFAKDVILDDDTVVTLTMWDTAGQEQYDSVRPMSYTTADLIFMCYSIEAESTLPNIRSKWIPEVQRSCDSIEFFLVGLKKDVRLDGKSPISGSSLTVDQSRLVTREMGEKIAREDGAVFFMEVSAKTGENVDELFRRAAAHIVDIRTREAVERKCVCSIC